MNYQKIYYSDLANGEGVRVSLFVSGCEHGCKGCYNVFSWKPESGIKFTEIEESKILQRLSDPFISGLTLSGGDPLYSGNLKDIDSLIDKVKYHYPDKDIWCWTGYTYNDIVNNRDNSELDRLRYDIVKKINILIDGKFIKEQKDPSLKWRGSSNQNIITVLQQ